MKQTVKPSKEEFEGILDLIGEVVDALSKLSEAVNDMRCEYPTHPALAGMRWWQLVAMSCRNEMWDITSHVMRARDDTTEGDEE